MQQLDLAHFLRPCSKNGLNILIYTSRDLVILTLFYQVVIISTVSDKIPL
jgi:hypothetical protein